MLLEASLFISAYLGIGKGCCISQKGRVPSQWAKSPAKAQLRHPLMVGLLRALHLAAEREALEGGWPSHSGSDANSISLTLAVRDIMGARIPGSKSGSLGCL